LLAKSLLAAVTVALGYWGYIDLYRPSNLEGLVDCFFRTLQLAYADFPPDLERNVGGRIPLALDIARFALPVLVVWVAATSLIRQLHQPLKIAGLGLASGHIIVAGDDPVVTILIRRARVQKRRTVFISDSPAAPGARAASALGATVVAGDSAESETWIRAGLLRAGVAFIVDCDDRAATAAALAARQAGDMRPGERRPAPVICALEHPDLRLLVESASRAAGPGNGVALQVTSLARMSARAAIHRYPLYRSVDVAAAEPVRALILGCGSTGEEVALQLLRSGVVGEEALPKITVVDRDPEAYARAVRSLHPEGEPIAAIRFIQGNLDHADIGGLRPVLDGDGAAKANVIYICMGDDTEAYLMAIAIRRAQSAAERLAPPIYVRQRGAHDLTAQAVVAESLAMDTTRICSFGALSGQADELLSGEALDLRAEAVHEIYLAQSPSRSGEPWSRLGDTFRQASRDQADFLPMRLALLGLRQAAGEPEPLQLDAQALETAARTEHARWRLSMELMGWRWGDERSNPLKLHPSLVPYDSLPSVEQDKDRSVPGNAAEILAREGLKAVALADAPLSAGENDDPARVVAATRAALQAAKGLPRIVCKLDNEIVCDALHDLAQASPELLWRLELEGSVPHVLRRLPDDVSRAKARWLINNADQVLARRPR
jgi:hypothetical protein